LGSLARSLAARSFLPSSRPARRLACSSARSLARPPGLSRWVLGGSLPSESTSPELWGPDAREWPGGPTERRRHRRGACAGTQMAAPVPWACCAVLAATAVVYAQRHSPQEAPHVQYERLGSDVTLPCGTANWDAAVTWRVNGTDLTPDLLNGSQLMLRGLELGHSGLYACFHRDSWHLRHQVLLHVGLPPREPVLSCRSNTYPKGFYCTWHLPTPTYIPNTFNVTVLHGSKIMVCEKDPALKNRCHIRYMHLFSTIKYKVSISVSNALGHNPDPPENVVARPVPSNPRRLEVTWQTPSTWPDPESFPLKFFLRYRPLILDQWQHVELSDGTAHTITDAYAGKEYIIQVAAKDNEIGTWSDWSVAAHATPWTEEPRHLTTEAQAPETTTSTTSSLAPPPTTKICDPGELGSGGGPSALFLISVPVTVALAAAATTASKPGISEDVSAHLQRSRRPELSPQSPVSILHTGRRTFCILFRHNCRNPGGPGPAAP
ncbi:hypothetical protein MC885_008277, partial [Smutsia gigantea]